MEVRIKDNNGYVDADWTIEDGIMVVSPKVEFFPKDGDVLSSVFEGKYQGTFVFEEASECGAAIFYFALGADGRLFKGDGCNYFGYVDDARPATEEEKKKLFDKLKEEGFEWDAEKKELIKLKWRPKEGGSFWMPYHYAISVEFRPCNSLFNKGRDEVLLNKGWCFKTDAECQAFCDRLNNAINQVKP